MGQPVVDNASLEALVRFAWPLAIVGSNASWVPCSCVFGPCIAQIRGHRGEAKGHDANTPVNLVTRNSMKLTSMF